MISSRKEVLGVIDKQHEQLKSQLASMTKQRDDLLELSRDIVRNGTEVDVGGGDVAITTCDAFEALASHLEANYPEPLGELTERERAAIANVKGE